MINITGLQFALENTALDGRTTIIKYRETWFSVTWTLLFFHMGETHGHRSRWQKQEAHANLNKMVTSAGMLQCLTVWSELRNNSSLGSFPNSQTGSVTTPQNWDECLTTSIVCLYVPGSAVVHPRADLDHKQTRACILRCCYRAACAIPKVCI